jgi:hypothetical protein
MEKLTEKQINDLEWLQELIILGEIPYEDPDGNPYLMAGNLDYIKEELEQDVENALGKGESEYVDALETVVKYLKEEGL